MTCRQWLFPFLIVIRLGPLSRLLGVDPVNAPFLFWGFYNAIYPFIDKESRDNMQVIRSVDKL